MTAGTIGGGPLHWSGACLLLSTLALVAWSLCKRGDHGPIQRTLGAVLSPAKVIGVQHSIVYGTLFCTA